MKGQSEFFSGIMLVAGAVLVTAIAGMVLTGFFKQGTLYSENHTENKLTCVYYDFYAQNATFDANLDCTSGVNHTLNIVLRNTGEKNATIGNILVELDSGGLLNFYLDQSLLAGETRTFHVMSDDACVSIVNQSLTGYEAHIKSVHIGSLACPAVESLSENYLFLQGTNQSEAQPSKYSFAIWHFNSNLSDSSGNSNDGSFSGGSPTYTPGPVSGLDEALQLDGTDDYVDISSEGGADPSTQFTVTMWVKSNNNDTVVITNYQ